MHYEQYAVNRQWGTVLRLKNKRILQNKSVKINTRTSFPLLQFQIEMFAYFMLLNPIFMEPAPCGHQTVMHSTRAGSTWHSLIDDHRPQ